MDKTRKWMSVQEAAVRLSSCDNLIWKWLCLGGLRRVTAVRFKGFLKQGTSSRIGWRVRV